MSKDILVFADWEQGGQPQQVGLLKADIIRGSEVFRFSYADDWLTSHAALMIDPQLHYLFSGEQYNNDARNFRVFLDSCPDRWGRLLMQRREAVIARQESRKPDRLNESDYLLGVHDHYRMGSLRFKTLADGPFLDDNDLLAAPPISSLRELEFAVTKVEANNNIDAPDYLKWLSMLISPGSSLGGARPKACVSDDNTLWLAKFPSRYDDYDIAVWEYLAYLLAQKAGVKMAPCKLQRFDNKHHTFLTQRFDRKDKQRIHFSSAMTQLGYYDGDTGASYLELAHFISAQGANPKADLAQLWRRIVFNIAISNTDDHLRNHGFLLAPQKTDSPLTGWLLSPAYDINPTTDAGGLHLNIDETDNRLDYALALEVAPYFQLEEQDAKNILQEVIDAVAQWQQVAKRLGISRAEQQLMSPAFNVTL